MDPVGHPHAAAVKPAAVLGPSATMPPLLGHVAYRSDGRSKRSGIQDFLRLDAGAIKMLRQAHHELDAIGRGGVDHVVALVQADRHGFLHQDVLAGVAGVHGKAVVKLVAKDDGHGFNLVVRQQLRVGFVPPGDIVLFHVFTALFLEQVRDRDDLYAILVGDGLAVRTGDTAQADDTDAQIRHRGDSFNECG